MAHPRVATFAIDVGSKQLVLDGDGGIEIREVDVPVRDGLAPPPGDELFRFATVSDVHVGLDEVGRWPRIVDRDTHLEPPGERCLRGAVSAAVAWGAELLVAKGDITQRGTVDELHRALTILREPGVSVDVTLGNHEVKRHCEPLAPELESSGVIVAEQGVQVRDVPGLRIVVFDSTIKGSHRGSYDRHADDVVDAAAEAGGPVLVLTHHHPQPLPVPHHWPPGVPSPEGDRLLRRLRHANPDVWLSTGHTHRNRRRDRCGVVVTEVASTHDYPGVWAGYVVHEGGLRQVVRRIADPDAVRWIEATRRTFLGLWARWAPGRLGDRCLSHAWSG